MTSPLPAAGSYLYIAPALLLLALIVRTARWTIDKIKAADAKLEDERAHRADVERATQYCNGTLKLSKPEARRLLKRLEKRLNRLK